MQKQTIKGHHQRFSFSEKPNAEKFKWKTTKSLYKTKQVSNSDNTQNVFLFESKVKDGYIFRHYLLRDSCFVGA